MDEIRFKLNGEDIVHTGDPSERVLEVLRETYGLTGVKCGCREGECGACSILLNEVLVNSCMLAMGRLEGCRVVTIEGFSKTPQFQVLSDAYAAVSAVQCGYCTPGMILASHCVLKEYPHPTRGQIQTGISGNLCRCTGYQAIVRAVLIASEKGEGLW